ILARAETFASKYSVIPSIVDGLGMGLGAGTITVMIRLWGGYPEGVTYGILLMNIVTPLIDRYTIPRVYGTVAEKGLRR
ncbi:MAG: Na+-transporting NADH:ubiquinone oxidoreductase subunit D, partial [Firmicutes bacterium]|nr:Na+-transporting NADH:ubiquinone oxidoreductase subunit D [Bacillota bacterium]